MWELHRKEGWVPKNWCFQIVVLEKTLESLLESKEIKPVNPKGNQPWIFIRRINVEAEAPILWPLDAESWLIGKETLMLESMGWQESDITSVQSLSSVTPGTAAHQASLSITSSWSLPKLMPIESVMPSNHILCYPLLLLPSIFPSIRVFSSESVLHIRWLKYWSFSFNISPSNEHPGLISFRMEWLDPCSTRDSQESSPTLQFKSINSSVLSFLYSPGLTSIQDHWKNHSLD